MEERQIWISGATLGLLDELEERINNLGDKRKIPEGKLLGILEVQSIRGYRIGIEGKQRPTLPLKDTTGLISPEEIALLDACLDAFYSFGLDYYHLQENFDVYPLHLLRLYCQEKNRLFRDIVVPLAPGREQEYQNLLFSPYERMQSLPANSQPD